VQSSVGEVGVLRGELVGAADHRQPEALRGLATAQQRTAEYLVDRLPGRLVDLDDGVC